MHALKKNLHGNANVGLFGVCTERHCILGIRLTPEEEREIAAALQAELLIQGVAGTPMAGVFLASTSRGLLAPGILFENERRALERIAPVKIFQTHHTCLGNNIVATAHGCLVNPEFSDAEIAELQQMLGVPVKRIEIAGTMTPGACIVVNGTRGIIHRDAAEHEIAMAKETLGLDSLEPASVNLGSPYVRAGIIANAHGMIIGAQSGGPEIVHAEQSLREE